MARIFARKERRNTLVAIVGPTASGKSDLAVQLAKRFNGEVVSADSRQVYKGLDIGSGKITKKEAMGIPHFLLDVASPKRKFTVAQYQKLALKAIRNIQKRGKLPILVGGTPFYVYAVVDNLTFPEVKPNQKLRTKLEKLSAEQLFTKLQKLDSNRADALRESSGQEKNKRRLIRALEIVVTTGKPVPPPSPTTLRWTSLFDVLVMGIKKSPEELKARIHKRLQKRLESGMVEEVQRLHAAGLPWRRLEEFGLEYRNVAQYLQQKITYEEMVTLLEKAINDFARRQMVWFKRDPRIHWIENQKQAEQLVRRSLASHSIV